MSRHILLEHKEREVILKALREVHARGLFSEEEDVIAVNLVDYLDGLAM